MQHTLINTIIFGIVVAFIFGMIAKRIKLPAVFGYLLAGVAIGPFTPGIVADVHLAQELAEIGIILLMFGVGLHFSYRDLMAVKNIAIPGALFQMGSAAVIGTVGLMFLGFSLAEGVIYGFALSVASTIVLLRTLESRKKLTTTPGKIAIGWLIIEDIFMVLALVLLPVVAQFIEQPERLDIGFIGMSTALVLLKVGGFFAVMFIVGRRVLPWVLTRIARQGSSELNTIGTLAIALGMAYVAYAVFDASLALGAFLAGMVLNESKIGHKFAENTLPLRDTFSVLFFVSVGMLFNPATLVNYPLAVIMTFLIIVFAKGAAALLICRMFKQDRDTGYTVAMGLAQIGEFSFILGSMALSRNLITSEIYDFILAGAMLSIVVNPFLFRLYDMWNKPKDKDDKPEAVPA
ncbi:MAG: cation:proton antiporter [Asticcacaulis sp.]